MILGIDPGVRGGLAILQADGKLVHVQAFDPKDTEHRLVYEVIHALDLIEVDPFHQVYVERVGYMRGDGGKGAFTFGKIVGLIHGAVLSRSLFLHQVSPQMWQTRMECLTGGNKNISKRRAQHLFPYEKITHAVADAILIAEFGRRQSLSF